MLHSSRCACNLRPKCSPGSLSARLLLRWGNNAGRRWKGGRGPTASVNFVTAHDGFTMADLVSYNEKHNEANGENNRWAGQAAWGGEEQLAAGLERQQADSRFHQ